MNFKPKGCSSQRSGEDIRLRLGRNVDQSLRMSGKLNFSQICEFF